MLPVFTGILRPFISIEKSSTASGSDLRGLADLLGRITFCLIGKLGRNDDDRTLDVGCTRPDADWW